MTKHVLIVQPYVPGYRVPFFEGLRSTLTEDDIECTVIAGRPDGAQKLRADATAPPWLIQRNDRTINVRGIQISDIAHGHDFSRYDAIVASAAGTSVDAYRALVGAGRKKRAVGLWGHIDSYVAPANPIDLRLEKWQMRRADRVFAYTPSGARFAERFGITPEKITTVMNSVDVSGLVSNAPTKEECEAFRSTHGCSGRPVFAFWGGLDESKRIGFLAEMLDELWLLDRSIHLFVGGKGADEPLLAAAVARGQVTLLGFIGALEKRILGAIAEAVLMPGRIGLIAVETLALGVPILTTTWPFHAPEFEYLVEGESVYVLDDDSVAFAAAMADWRRSDAEVWAYPTVGDMVANFASGVKQML